MAHRPKLARRPHTIDNGLRPISCCDRLDGLVELSLPDRRLKQVVLRACAAAMILDRKRPAARDPRLAHVQSAATGARARTWRSPWIFGSDAGGRVRVGLRPRCNHRVARGGVICSFSLKRKPCEVFLRAKLSSSQIRQSFSGSTCRRRRSRTARRVDQS